MVAFVVKFISHFRKKKGVPLPIKPLMVAFVVKFTSHFRKKKGVPLTRVEGDALVIEIC